MNSVLKDSGNFLESSGKFYQGVSIVLFSIILIVSLYLIYYFGFIYRKDYIKSTATVIDVSKCVNKTEESNTSNSGSNSTSSKVVSDGTIKISFKNDDKVIDHSFNVSNCNEYRKNQVIDITFDPKNPFDTVSVNINSKKNFLIIFSILSAVSFLIILYNYFASKNRAVTQLSGAENIANLVRKF